MGLNVRKFVVGVLALSVLAGLFLLYLRFNRTPPILVEAGKSVPAPAGGVRDANSPESMGTISGVGGVRDLGVTGGDDHPAHAHSLRCPLVDPLNNRLAGKLHKWLAGESCRGHSGRNHCRGNHTGIVAQMLAAKL